MAELDCGPLGFIQSSIENRSMAATHIPHQSSTQRTASLSLEENSPVELGQLEPG